jgi:hypothetical protein
MSIQSLLDEAMAVRWPDRGGVVIPPGRYTVKETLVIDPGPFTDGSGNHHDSRGKGPHIFSPGVTIVPDPDVDWTGRSVIELAGTSVRMNGLRVDSRGHKKPPAFGIVGGVVAREDGSGHSYHGGPSTLIDVECIGGFTRAAIGFINWEMVECVGCDFLNELSSPLASAVYIGRGIDHSGDLKFASRIAQGGFTQTRVRIIGGRLRSSGTAPVVSAFGYTGQVNIECNIITNGIGFVYLHTGDCAVQTVLRENRWESDGGTEFSYFGVAPMECLIEGNFLTRHGTKQVNHVLAGCPDTIKAANIRFSRNKGWKPVVNTRKTLATA